MDEEIAAQNKASIHWNYFLTIEQDLINLSRYIEFTEGNFNTYSTELTRLLISTASEVDVLLREFCNDKNPTEKRNVRTYREFFQNTDGMEGFINEDVIIPKYNLSFRPWAWDIWLDDDEGESKRCPEWWDANNKVKHQRSSEYQKGNLKNVLNAFCALYIVNTFTATKAELEKPKLIKTKARIAERGIMWR